MGKKLKTFYLTCVLKRKIMKLRKALAFIIFLGLSASTSSQVLWGEAAFPYSIKYLVFVQIRFDNGIPGQVNVADRFSGIIISERFILTVAAKFKPLQLYGSIYRPSRVIVQAGVKDWRDGGQVRETDMDHVHPHPLYQPNGNGRNRSYDVALIHLAGEELHLSSSNRATKAVLPVGFYGNVIEMPPGTEYKITGWGATHRGYPHAPEGFPDRAMEAVVEVKNDQQCLNANFPFYERNKHLCYGCKQPNLPRCESAGMSDEGGPVSCKVAGVNPMMRMDWSGYSEMWTVFAVHSFGRNNYMSERDTLNVGVRLDEEKIDWIKATMWRLDSYGTLVHRITSISPVVGIMYLMMLPIFVMVVLIGMKLLYNRITYNRLMLR